MAAMKQSVDLIKVLRALVLSLENLIFTCHIRPTTKSMEKLNELFVCVNESSIDSTLSFYYPRQTMRETKRRVL